MRHILVTTPRTGSNYLFQLILQKSQGTDILKSHDINKSNRRIITIARDPFDSIVSRLVMHRMLSKDMTEEDYMNMIEDNLNVYNDLVEHSDIVIDYNDLVSNPLGVVDYLVKATDNSYNDRLLKMKLKDKPSVGYLVTSKVSGDYEDCVSIVEGWDISDLYEAYKPLYAKCIKIGD